MELYTCCAGDWKSVANEVQITSNELYAFLEYAATFLSNIGNYYVRILRSRLHYRLIRLMFHRALATKNLFLT